MRLGLSNPVASELCSARALDRDPGRSLWTLARDIIQIYYSDATGNDRKQGQLKKNRSTVIDKINRSPDRAKYTYKVFKSEFLGFPEAVKKLQLLASNEH